MRYEDLLAGRDGFAGSDISCGGGGKEAEAGEAEGMGRCGVGRLKWEEVPGKGAFAHYFGAGIGCGNVVEVVEVSRKEDEGWEGNVKLEW